MDDSDILKLCDIKKTYPGVVALGGVSLSVKRGEVHSLVGENGAGKSTLIKTVSGAIEPDSGKIIVDGKAFESLSPKESEENGVSVIYQEFNLVPSLSVAENIFLGSPLKKWIFVDKNKLEREWDAMNVYVQEAEPTAKEGAWIKTVRPFYNNVYVTDQTDPLQITTDGTLVVYRIVLITNILNSSQMTKTP
jgi:ribose transport system ATP-binding protein